MNREQIYAALFAKLQAGAGFKTVSRRLKHWSDVPASEQPALFQAQRQEVVTAVPGQPQVWMFMVDLYVYVHSQSAKTVPSTELNGLMDAIVLALQPDPITNKCTLGGLVQHAWIEGAIQTDEGTLGDQAVAIVPIVIKVV